MPSPINFLKFLAEAAPSDALRKNLKLMNSRR
jgi:hypothetical protein